MAKLSTPNPFLKLAVAASLITAAFSTPLDPSRLVPRDDASGVQTTAAKQLDLGSAFGASIEGASVNKAGDVFAVDFRGKDATTTPNSFGFFHQTDGGVNNVAGQDPIVIAKGAKDTFLAGSRFVKKGAKVLIADAQNKRVMSVDVATKKVSVFCENAKMLQPNDIAVSTKRECLIYLSGQKYEADSIAGEHGDLWTCDGNKATQFSPAILKKADIHRTNGIEVDPKGEFLYLTSATNVKSGVVNLKVFKFALDKETGALLEQDPVVFHDFSHAEKGTDLDGMRTDVDGNLYVSLNAAGKIAKLDPSGKLVQYITTPGVKGPSNLELGGKDGKTLFAVGKCEKDQKAGCAASIGVDKPGRAYAALNA
ncbi:hypothetical protein GX51_00402 [Blastomyces parvus]|uniref:SMP-30/Gluconolactonase/LRE-like region domain-containing protein n=1 Tax=Blastomyces parvus TaxID=2060905 RepID=A0A2B7XM56_9EURO|nr:hypothetical protein GX51_00402 [Blastomyces parvus]